MSTPTTNKRDDSLSYVHTARAALRSTSSKYLSAPEPPTSPPPVGPPPTPPPPGPPTGASGTTSPPTARLPTASNYRQSRQSELAALRQKGLAKIFNKHFTTASVQIAQERAAADAALSQIESRKAALKAQGRTHEVGEGGVSLSVLDSMYMDLQKRRDDVKKKERETMLLYRSYVSKFGTDDVNPSAAAMLQRRPSQGAVGGAAANVGRSGVSAPMTPGYQDQPHVKQSDIKTSQSREIENLTNSPGGVTSHTNRIESTVQNYNSTERMPSIATVGVDETLSHLREGEVVQGKLLERRQLEQAGIDAKASPSPAKNKKVWDGGKLSSFGSPPPLNEEDEIVEDEKRRQVGAEYSVPLSPPAERQPSRTQQSGQVVVPDVKSKMKPVPTQSSANEQAGGDKWEGKVGANVVITDNNAIPNDDLESSFASELTSSFASLGNTPIKRNKDTEDSTFPTYDLTTTLESDVLEDDDVLSTVSGLTSISQNASDAELRLADFLRNETETIRKMLQEDLDIDNRSAVTESSRASKTSRASAESKRAAKAAAQAEEMAKLMEEAVAWANDAVEHAGSAPKAPSGNNTTKGREVASDGKETWVAYWSDEHQREYYHEVNTNRVEWIMPDKFVDTAKLRRKAELGVNESGGVKKDEEEERDDDEYSVEVVDYTKRKGGKYGDVSVASSVRSVGSYETGASSVAQQQPRSSGGNRSMSLSRQRSSGSVASVGGRSVTSSASVYSHEDFTPGDMVQRRSKAREYRKQRKRRQRMRRRMMAVVSAVVALAGGGYYYKFHYDGESLDLGGFDFGSIFGGGDDGTLEEVDVQQKQRRGSVGTKKKETEPTKKKKPTTTQKQQPSKVKPSGGGDKVEGEQKARVKKPTSGSGVKTTTTATTDGEKKQVKKKKKKKKKTSTQPAAEGGGSESTKAQNAIPAEKRVKSSPSTSSGDETSTATKTPTSSTVGAKDSTTTTPGKTGTTTETTKDAAKEAEAGGMTSMIWWSGGEATDDSSPPSTDNKGAVATTSSSSSSSSAVAKSTVSRPVGCYVPLAYVISGECRKKATEKPLFDLQSLSDSMMQ